MQREDSLLPRKMQRSMSGGVFREAEGADRGGVGKRGGMQRGLRRSSGLAAARPRCYSLHSRCATRARPLTRLSNSQRREQPPLLFRLLLRLHAPRHLLMLVEGREHAHALVVELL